MYSATVLFYGPTQSCGGVSGCLPSCTTCFGRLRQYCPQVVVNRPASAGQGVGTVSERTIDAVSLGHLIQDVGPIFALGVVVLGFGAFGVHVRIAGGAAASSSADSGGWVTLFDAAGAQGHLTGNPDIVHSMLTCFLPFSGTSSDRAHYFAPLAVLDFILYFGSDSVPNWFVSSSTPGYRCILVSARR